MSILIIAEKSSMSKKYKAALPFATCTNVVGHIDEFVKLETLLKLGSKPKWKDIAPHLPFIPTQFNYTVIPKFKHLVELIYSLALKADEIVLACDPDREGEAIHRALLEILISKNKAIADKTITRIWLHSETKKEIESAFKARKDYREYDNYYTASKVRNIIDWLTGIQLTVLYTTKFSTSSLLSVGRVQSWLLSEIVKRCDEHINFQPKPYSVFSFKDGHGVLHRLVSKDKRGKIQQTKVFDKDEVLSITNELKQVKQITISDVDKKEFTESPPNLFDLLSLQKSAYSAYSYSADKVLKLAQALYEKNLLSYPRTDCNKLAQAEADNISNSVELIRKVGCLGDELSILDGTSDIICLHKKNIGEIKGHYAIIPVLTHEGAIPVLNKEEMNIFKLVSLRLLLNLMTDAKGFHTNVISNVEDRMFLSTFKKYTELGFLKLTGGVNNMYTKYNVDDVLPVEFVKEDKMTTAPPLYNNGSILTLMERAHLLIANKELKDALKDAGGIGTAATRASYLPLLIKRGYVEKKGNAFMATDKGAELYKILPVELTIPDFSAQLEHDLHEIISNNSKKDIPYFVTETKALLVNVFKKVREMKTTPNSLANKDNDKEVGTCPVCGKNVSEFAKVYSCVDRNCKFVIWKNIAGGVITSKRAKELLSTGITKDKVKMKSKAGKSFSAYLSLESDCKIKFRFQ